MERVERDEEREERIIMEIIVDANPDEQAMGWYYYLEEQLHTPFRAICISKQAKSPLRAGDQVEVIGMPSEEEWSTACSSRFDGRSGNWPFRWRNSKALVLTSRPPKRSPIGTIGSAGGMNYERGEPHRGSGARRRPRPEPGGGGIFLRTPSLCTTPRRLALTTQPPRP